MATTPNHGARAHARMSPSTAHQWTHCDAWLALTADLPETPSGPAAREGTLAHEWAELALRNNEATLDGYVGTKLPDGRAGSELTQEMADYLRRYLETVQYRAAIPGAEFQIETRLSLAPYFNGSDDGDGTADAIVYDANARHLHVFDLKYGAGQMVEARGNPQALQYGLGAYELFKARGIRALTIWIVQPRAYDEKVKRWDVDMLELFAWVDEMQAAVSRNRSAEACHASEPQFPTQDAANPGEHCRWCKANYWGKCPALKASVDRIAADGFTAAPVVAAPAGSPDTRPDTLGARLRELPALRAYCSALEARAEDEARAGRMPDGFKWVATVGRRKWVDEAATRLACAALGFDPFEKSLKTPAVIEKEIGKAKFREQLANLATKPESYSLVPVDDKRAAATPDFVASSGFSAT